MVDKRIEKIDQYLPHQNRTSEFQILRCKGNSQKYKGNWTLFSQGILQLQRNQEIVVIGVCLQFQPIYLPDASRITQQREYSTGF